MAKANATKTFDEGKKTVYFIGDSLTRRCDLDEFYPDYVTLNLGISRDTLGEFMQRGEHFRFENAPDAVVFLMGINDLNFENGQPIPMEGLYRRLFKEWKRYPKMKIIVQSLYPVVDCGITEYAMAPGINDKIVELNTRLKALCAEMGLYFADIHSRLKTGERLNPIFADDCIHINRSGYEIVAKCVNSAIKRAFNDDN